MHIFLFFSVIICSSCFWSVTPVLVNLAFCCGLRTTLTPRATSAPLVSTSRLEPLNWTAKPSSCKFGTLLAKKDLEQSHPGKFCFRQALNWELPLFSCFHPEVCKTGKICDLSYQIIPKWYDPIFIKSHYFLTFIMWLLLTKYQKKNSVIKFVKMKGVHFLLSFNVNKVWQFF